MCLLKNIFCKIRFKGVSKNTNSLKRNGFWLNSFCFPIFFLLSPSATTVDHAGSGNIHPTHHSTITNHWLATQSPNSWLDSVHKMHHPWTTQTPHPTTTAKVECLFNCCEIHTHTQHSEIYIDIFFTFCFYDLLFDQTNKKSTTTSNNKNNTLTPVVLTIFMKCFCFEYSNTKMN